MDTGKQTTTRERVQPGIRIAPRDEYAFAGLSVIVLPFDGYAMRGVLARYADAARNPLRADLLQSNETDARNCMLAAQLRSEFRGQERLNNVRHDPVVEQDTSADYACQCGYLN